MLRPTPTTRHRAHTPANLLLVKNSYFGLKLNLIKIWFVNDKRQLIGYRLDKVKGY